LFKENQMIINFDNVIIKELLFALRRDFKISKDIINTLSKIRSTGLVELIMLISKQLCSNHLLFIDKAFILTNDASPERIKFNN